MSRVGVLGYGFVTLALSWHVTYAQPAAQSVGDLAPASQQSPVPGPGAAAPEGAPAAPGSGGLFSATRTNLLGDLGGLRPALETRGISLGLQETSEVWGNVSGGTHRGAAYNGLTTVSLGVDTAKAFGWDGGIFNVSAFQIHGRNLSTDNLQTLQTASGIEAQRATRLWEIWFQQSFLGGKMDVKVGQQSLDQEFIGSQYSAAFINTAAGWPVLPSVNLYAGGPAYPLASLGVRLRAQPMDNLTVLAGVFDDNPPGGPFYDDGQVRGAAQSGTKFHTGTGALIIGEAQYAINAPVEGQKPSGLPGVYKIGFWYDTGTFYDQRFDDGGLSLANPASSGVRRPRRHDWSIYGVVDQAVWRPDPEAARSVGVFARLMGAPGDRNLANFSVNAGVVMKAPFASRENDSVGLEFGVANIGANATRFDRDTNVYSGPYPVRSSETFLELTYQYQVAPWWTLQPDVQYVWMPGGGIQNPLNPTKRIGNEAVFGLRTNIVF